MKVEPGDVAVIIDPMYHGKLVSVHYAMPQGVFNFPDGSKGSSNGVIEPTWICESLCSKIQAPTVGGGLRPSRYISIVDRKLRPIRNEPGADETLSWKDVPQEVKA
jgi:hypothetical protein